MRSSLFTIILGTNGTGKTAILKKIVAKSQRPVLIVTPDTIEWREVDEIQTDEIHNFSSVKKVVYNYNLAEIYQNVYDCLLIFDDFRAFGIPRKEYAVLRKIVVRRRQKMIDLFIVAHGFTEIVPYFLYSFASRFILFRTHDNPMRVSAALNDAEKVKRLQLKVNNESQKKLHYYLIFKNI